MRYLGIIVSLSCLLLVQGAAVEYFQINTTGRNVNKPVGMEWSNCGPPESPIKFLYFNLEPHPLKPGRAVNFSTAVNVSKDIGVSGQNLSLDASLKFKAGERFRDLCELLGLECHIENLCHLLGNGSMSCQWIFQQSGFYCKCPIMADVYSIEISQIVLPFLGFSIHGTFILEVAIKDSDSMLGCLSIEVCLKETSIITTTIKKSKLSSIPSHRCPLFRRWLCRKAASGLGRIVCGLVVGECHIYDALNGKTKRGVYYCADYDDMVEQMTIDDNKLLPKWTNCAEEKSPIILKNFSLTPDPVILGQFIRLSATVVVSRDIGLKDQHVSGEGSIRIKIGGRYSEICDSLYSGTCRTDDFCIWIQRLAKRRGCPEFLVKQGFNCTCPVKAGIYVIDRLLIPVPSFDLDIHGTFDVSAALRDDISMLSCFEFKFCINKC